MVCPHNRQLSGEDNPLDNTDTVWSQCILPLDEKTEAFCPQWLPLLYPLINSSPTSKGGKEKKERVIVTTYIRRLPLISCLPISISTHLLLHLRRDSKKVTVCVDLALSFEKGELAIWLTNDSPTLNLLVWKPSPLQPSTLPQQGLKPLQSNWVSATATKICTGHCFTSSCLVGCYANWPRLFTHCFLSLMCFNTTVDHDKFQ